MVDIPNWKKSKPRKDASAGAEAMEVGWEKCAEITDLSFILMPYMGAIYFDLPVDEADPRYQAICSFFEHPDGKQRFKSIQLFILPLELAMTYAFTDEPGFWEKEAENF